MIIVVPYEINDTTLVSSSIQNDYPDYDPGRGGDFDLLDNDYAIGLARGNGLTYILHKTGWDSSKISVYDGGSKITEQEITEKYYLNDITYDNGFLYLTEGYEQQASILKVDVNDLSSQTVIGNNLTVGINQQISITFKNGTAYIYGGDEFKEMSSDLTTVVNTTTTSFDFFFSKVKSCRGGWAVLGEQEILITDESFNTLYNIPINSARNAREGGMQVVDDSIYLLDALERVVEIYSIDGTSLAEYLSGERVVVGEDVYEALVNTTDSPTTGVNKTPPTWLLVGKSNKWRGFRNGKDSKSTADSPVTLEFTFPMVVDTVSFLGVEASTVRLVGDDNGTVFYDETIAVNDGGVDSMYDFYFMPLEPIEDVVFSDIPPYVNATFTVTIDGVGSASFGQCVFGLSRDLGVTLSDTSIGFENFSIRSRDEFGFATITPRRIIDKVDFNCHVDTSRTGFVRSVLKSAASTPALYVGVDKYEGTTIFGIPDEPKIGLTSPSKSDMTITVRGI